MKRTFILMAVPFFMISCGGNTAQSVQAPDVAAYQAVELTSKSNSDRILTLERELDTAKNDIATLQVQNRQLADSYDGMVELFKEHRNLTLKLIQQMMQVTPPVEEEQK
jgi:hypothetical protein